MEWIRKLVLILSLVLLSSLCWAEENVTIIDTGIPSLSGHISIDGSRYAMISFDLREKYRVTAVEIYLRTYHRAGDVTLDLTKSTGPGPEGLLRRRPMKRSQRGSTQRWEPVVLDPVTLDPGTYYVVVSTRGFGSIAALPYRAPNILPEVGVYRSKLVNAVSPHTSTWVPLDKNVYNVGLRVIGRPVEDNAP